jgi:hypothetical protein
VVRLSHLGRAWVASLVRRTPSPRVQNRLAKQTNVPKLGPRVREAVFRGRRTRTRPKLRGLSLSSVSSLSLSLVRKQFSLPN